MPGHQPSMIDDGNNAVMAHLLSNGDEARLRETRALILVVDGRPDICDMLRQVLTIAGYRVTTALPGEAWIDQAMQSNDPPAFVLLDLSVPLIDADVFLRDLRLRWQAAPPILIMTTSKHIHDELRATERVVLKPFRVHDLLVALQEMLPPLE
ncbi:MAG: response regulator transcription factor [Ktedonobacteraceae bacterium]|nr:response regulator transcription factor [Ktedonobacteraceae bacterium]